MNKYLFTFDMTALKGEDYARIPEILTEKGLTVLDHPLESVYLIGTEEKAVGELCKRLENWFSAFSMAFVLCRQEEETYAEGATVKRRELRRQMEITRHVEEIQRRTR